MGFTQHVNPAKEHVVPGTGMTVGAELLVGLGAGTDDKTTDDGIGGLEDAVVVMITVTGGAGAHALGIITGCGVTIAEERDDEVKLGKQAAHCVATMQLFEFSNPYL